MTEPKYVPVMSSGSDSPTPTSLRPDFNLLDLKETLLPEVNGNEIYSKLSSQPSTPSPYSSENSVVIDDGTVKVKRKLGLMSGTALIVGTMIGSGIFISPKGVIAGTGSVALSMIVWVGCGVISLFGKEGNSVLACKQRQASIWSSLTLEKSGLECMK